MTLASPSSAPEDKSILLGGISWSLYQHMLSEISNGGIRLTYDRGWLEIMTLSLVHEKVKKIVARLIEAYGDEEGIDVEGGGSTTFAKEELEQGLEPDECYYIANAQAVKGKTELDLAVDPVPDLAIEVVISRPLIPKQPIYAALGIGEVWRYERGRLAPLILSGDHYVEAERSLAFPNLAMGRFNEFVAIGLTDGQSAAVRALREWHREGNG